jgi:5-formyltetrahydrofolate cyclo-ligase
LVIRHSYHQNATEQPTTFPSVSNFLQLSYVTVKTSYDRGVSISSFARPLPTDSKQDWRQWAKRNRSGLAVPSLSQDVIAQLQNWQPYQEATHILSYLAFGSELDITPLHRDKNKKFYITRAWRDTKTLTVHELGAGLETHPYGYLQPAADTPIIDPKTLDLVLVPGLCFDISGTRLGYGAGHFDRFLPALRPNTPRVGVTANALVVVALPRESFDIPMTHLVTETGVKGVT